jgi:hypothetical protein
MAWKPETQQLYSKHLDRIGCALVGQVGNTPRAIIRLRCGHDKIIPSGSIPSLTIAHKFRCHECLLSVFGDA